MRVTRTIIAMALVVALASCDEELGQVEVSTVQLQLTTGIASTRAGIDATAFDAGDAIGVFAYAGRSDKESWNIKATTDSKSWNFEKPVSLFPQNTAVYAYYPWNRYATDNHEYGFTVDAITQTNYMVGCDSVSEGNPKAQIVFRHITSKVSFKITNVDTNAELASAMLNGTKLPLSGKYLFEEGFVSMAANATSWINSKNIIGFGNGRHNVEFLMFPNSANCGATLGLTYKDGTMYSTEFTLPALEENCRYAYNVRVSEDSMKISSPVIAPWNNPSTMDEIVMETHTGHQYVDLGLSVNWATFNVGATAPEDYGDYFAWGATEPWYQSGYAQSESPVWKSGKSAAYTWVNTPYQTVNTTSSSSTKWTKYLGSTTSSYKAPSATDADALKTVLDPEDDAARANWGGSWRMPMIDEFQELIDNCTWTWTTLNGVKGHKVVSKSNGNSIFLPAAGYRIDTSLSSAGSIGLYWSSSLDEGRSYNARSLWFDSDGRSTSNFVSRSYGQSVRPVCSVPVTDFSLNRQSVEIIPGGTESLTATVQYENGATSNIATWSSSNRSIATVDQTGKVTAVSVGTCTITATSGSCTATCSVTVKAEYVDLGLSVRWATCNVGATAPEAYGDYFAWGATEPLYEPVYAQWSNPVWKSGKSAGYTWVNTPYQTANTTDYSSTKWTKYLGSTSSSYKDASATDADALKTVLDPADDAAHVNWGGSWRMPTKAEQDELRNTSNCTWTWTTLNGVNGYKVQSRKSGYTDNWIFLPAAGYRNGTYLDYFRSRGYYWSSSLDTSGPYHAYYLHFNSGDVDWYSSSRYNGQSVRPVCPFPVTSISLDKQSLDMIPDGTETLTATVQYENGATAKIEDAVWSSSNTSIATVDQTGKVRAISVGTCTITASSGLFSATCSVTVKPWEPTYVDLGLSVRWATCNVGATAPEDYGDYFAWGETSPKSDYSWSNYKYCKGSYDTMTKYCTESYYGYNGYTDSKTVLDPEDDAAHVNWGGSWRMPTKAEQDELREKCTWTWTTMNGKNGYKVVSKVNGNSVFLPAAGYRGGSSLYNAGSDGYYWSSSLETGYSRYAYYLYFNSGDVDWSNYDRYDGRSVRPVCP